MKTSDMDESIRRWLDRPLCCRYVTAIFSSIPAVSQRDAADERWAVCWALGGLIDGEVEVLGAWLNPGDGLSHGVFGDLYRRGVESVRLGIGNLTAAEHEFKRTFRHAAVAASVEQTLASAVARVPPRFRSLAEDGLRTVANADDLHRARAELAKFQTTNLSERYPAVVACWDEAMAGLEPFFALPAPLQRLVRSVDRTAQEIGERLTRAIHRHGPFVDSDAALEFVARALELAERRLDRERAASVRHGVRAIPAASAVRASAALGLSM